MVIVLLEKAWDEKHCTAEEISSTANFSAFMVALKTAKRTIVETYSSFRQVPSELKMVNFSMQKRNKWKFNFLNL